MLSRQLRLALGVAGLASAAYFTSSGCSAHGTPEPQVAQKASVQPLRARTQYTTTPEPRDARGPDASAVRTAVLEAKPELLGDGRLAELASWAADERRAQGTPPSTLDVDRVSRELGLVTPFPMLLFVDTTMQGWQTDLKDAIAGQPSSASQNRFGVSVGTDGRAVVALATHYADLDPVPRRIATGTAVSLKAKLAAGWTSPEWLVTGPDGAVRRLSGDLAQSLGDLDRGTHQIELLARGPHGLEVIANFPVGVDSDPKVENPELAGITWGATDEAFLEAANKIRKHAGLPPLTRDPKLDELASGHTRDMAQNRYFAHQSPTQGSTHERMRRAGFPYPRYGENIGRARSAEEIHALWLRSPGHRANLLDPTFTHVGIGVYVDKSTSPPVIIATQEFGG